jgi:hypothetical protein
MVDLDQPATFGDIDVIWLGGEPGAVVGAIAIDDYEG